MMRIIDRGMGNQKLTSVTGRRVSGLVPFTGSTSEADKTTWHSGSGNKVQLDLNSIRVWVASIHRLEEGLGISAFRHEHLGGVVVCGVLRSVNKTPTPNCYRSTYFSVNDGMDDAPRQHAVD